VGAGALSRAIRRGAVRASEEGLALPPTPPQPSDQQPGPSLRGWWGGRRDRQRSRPARLRLHPLPPRIRHLREGQSQLRARS